MMDPNLDSTVQGEKPAPNSRFSASSAPYRDRLPTLQEVLARKTRPPVDLYCFYLYLQRERAEDVLDFWLDAQQHENLCRAYFKDLRRSHIPLSEHWPQYYERARTEGSVFNGINKIQRIGSPGSRLEKDGPESGRSASAMSGAQPRASSATRTPSPNPPMHPGASHLSPTLRALFPHDQHTREGEEEEEKRRLRVSQGAGKPNAPAQPIIPRSSAITRHDLLLSASRIYHRYLLTGSEKEIYLPPSLRIHDFPIQVGEGWLPRSGEGQEEEEEKWFEAGVPDLFVGAKEYVYRSMEQDTFPRFLRSKAFGNLTPLSALVRLSLGLVALWAALTTAFALILLDVRPRRTRFWIILPFAVGILGVLSHFYALDPVLLLLGNASETTPFRTLKVKEKYVRKILRGRALWILVVTTLLTTAICALFIAVPGHRI